VTVASDLRGRSGQPANLVAHGPRLDLPSYAELQFNYDMVFGRVRARTVITLAVNENLFHFTGRFDGTFAVRNLYLEAQGVFSPHLSLWVGSRMYRGDDVYLLNWWPLDNLNTVGGGARYEFAGRVVLQAQVGMNRLDDPYQLQSIRIAPREGFGPQQALLLDRPRLLASAKATYFLQPLTARAGFKLSLYGELHSMAAGVRQTNDAGARELLPADGGTVLGAQLGGWTGERSTFFNVWVRYARGLGAYGDLRVPVSQGTARTAERAEEFLVAAAGNWERGAFGVLLGAYARYFRDADPSVFSRGALWEGAVAVRPTVWFGEHLGLSLEGSYQRIVYNALDPVTGDGAAQGSLFRVGVVPFVTPGGRGNFTRPHLQVIYAATVRDDGARRLYAPDDPFGFNSVEHFLGLGTEWWFNSSYL
jgi:maltoporin